MFSKNLFGASSRRRVGALLLDEKDHDDDDDDDDEIRFTASEMDYRKNNFVSYFPEKETVQLNAHQDWEALVLYLRKEDISASAGSEDGGAEAGGAPISIQANTFLYGPNNSNGGQKQWRKVPLQIAGNALTGLREAASFHNPAFLQEEKQQEGHNTSIRQTMPPLLLPQMSLEQQQSQNNSELGSHQTRMVQNKARKPALTVDTNLPIEDAASLLPPANRQQQPQETNTTTTPYKKATKRSFPRTSGSTASSTKSPELNLTKSQTMKALTYLKRVGERRHKLQQHKAAAAVTFNDNNNDDKVHPQQEEQQPPPKDDEEVAAVQDHSEIIKKKKRPLFLVPASMSRKLRGNKKNSDNDADESKDNKEPEEQEEKVEEEEQPKRPEANQMNALSSPHHPMASLMSNSILESKASPTRGVRSPRKPTRDFFKSYFEPYWSPTAQNIKSPRKSPSKRYNYFDNEEDEDQLGLLDHACALRDGLLCRPDEREILFDCANSFDSGDGYGDDDDDEEEEDILSVMSIEVRESEYEEDEDQSPRHRRRGRLPRLPYSPRTQKTLKMIGSSKDNMRLAMISLMEQLKEAKEKVEAKKKKIETVTEDEEVDEDFGPLPNTPREQDNNNAVTKSNNGGTKKSKMSKLRKLKGKKNLFLSQKVRAKQAFKDTTVKPAPMKEEEDKVTTTVSPRMDSSELLENQEEPIMRLSEVEEEGVEALITPRQSPRKLRTKNVFLAKKFTAAKQALKDSTTKLSPRKQKNDDINEPSGFDGYQQANVGDKPQQEQDAVEEIHLEKSRDDSEATEPIQDSSSGVQTVAEQEQQRKPEEDEASPIDDIFESVVQEVKTDDKHCSEVVQTRRTPFSGFKKGFFQKNIQGTQKFKEVSEEMPQSTQGELSPPIQEDNVNDLPTDKEAHSMESDKESSAPYKDTLVDNASETENEESDISKASPEDFDEKDKSPNDASALKRNPLFARSTFKSKLMHRLGMKVPYSKRHPEAIQEKFSQQSEPAIEVISPKSAEIRWPVWGSPVQRQRQLKQDPTIEMEMSLSRALSHASNSSVELELVPWPTETDNVQQFTSKDDEPEIEELEMTLSKIVSETSDSSVEMELVAWPTDGDAEHTPTTLGPDGQESKDGTSAGVSPEDILSDLQEEKASLNAAHGFESESLNRINDSKNEQYDNLQAMRQVLDQALEEGNMDTEEENPTPESRTVDSDSLANIAAIEVNYVTQKPKSGRFKKWAKRRQRNSTLHQTSAQDEDMDEVQVKNGIPVMAEPARPEVKSFLTAPETENDVDNEAEAQSEGADAPAPKPQLEKVESALPDENNAHAVHDIGKDGVQDHYTLAKPTFSLDKGETKLFDDEQVHARIAREHEKDTFGDFNGNNHDTFGMVAKVQRRKSRFLFPNKRKMRKNLGRLFSHSKAHKALDSPSKQLVFVEVGNDAVAPELEEPHENQSKTMMGRIGSAMTRSSRPSTNYNADSSHVSEPITNFRGCGGGFGDTQYQYPQSQFQMPFSCPPPPPPPSKYTQPKRRFPKSKFANSNVRKCNRTGFFALESTSDDSVESVASVVSSKNGVVAIDTVDSEAAVEASLVMDNNNLRRCPADEHRFSPQQDKDVQNPEKQSYEKISISAPVSPTTWMKAAVNFQAARAHYMTPPPPPPPPRPTMANHNMAPPSPPPPPPPPPLSRVLNKNKNDTDKSEAFMLPTLFEEHQEMMKTTAPPPPPPPPPPTSAFLPRHLKSQNSKSTTTSHSSTDKPTTTTPSPALLPEKDQGPISKEQSYIHLSYEEDSSNMGDINNIKKKQRLERRRRVTAALTAARKQLRNSQHQHQHRPLGGVNKYSMATTLATFMDARDDDDDSRSTSSSTTSSSSSSFSSSSTTTYSLGPEDDDWLTTGCATTAPPEQQGPSRRRMLGVSQTTTAGTATAASTNTGSTSRTSFYLL